MTKKTNSDNKKEKKNSKFKIIVGLIISILIILILIVFIFKIFDKNDSYKDKATYSTSFFIKNNKGKYALYNDSGKKLSDFVYDSVNSFINGSSLVYKEKEGYAIINEKGKEIISYGDYNYISSYSGLYKVRSDKGYKLLNSDGKVILEAEEIDVSSYGDEYPFNIVTAKNEVKVISYDGKTITTFKQNSSAKSPTVNHINEYATVFYDGKNVIFNSKTKKVITTFKNKNHYCVNTVSEDGKIIALNACSTWYETLSETGHILSVKGKITDLSNKCNSLTVYTDVVVCSSTNGEYFVNISGKKATIGDKISSRIAFIDEENYVTRDDKTYKFNFYKNGKKIKTMDASISSTGKVENEMYVLYVDNGYEYYNKEGKKAIKENFKYASLFDKNELARVSKDGSTYYLINENGKKISDKYYSISYYDDYYLVSNKKGLKGIIDKNGKEIIPTKYTSINIKKLRDKYYGIVSINNEKYAIYDLKTKSLLKESKHILTINEHYIKVSTEKKTSYYTYKDKLIFKE